MRHARRGRLHIPLLAFAVFAAACGPGDAAGPGVFWPELISTTAVPLSESEEVALLADERTACVIDSYEVRVRCVDAEGSVVGIFGREGEGPGEFGEPTYLTRGEAGTVGVVDSDLGRFTVFEPSGAHVSEVMLPAVFQPFPAFGAAVSGVSLDYMVMLGQMSGSLMTRYDVDLASGDVVGQEGSPPGPWDIECGQVIHGLPHPAGGWAFVACEGHLIFVGGTGDTGDATVVRAPMYVPELPDERDVARMEEELLAFNRSRGLPRSPAIDEGLERYRATPKNYHLSTGQQLFDGSNRYWIATQRDQHEWSWLDVYENAAYLGSVRVRDRLRAFDLLGSTLVVLVDRQAGPDDADGIPDRALDWYDIADLPFRR
ncbi:hypothetical protein [Candidatus Palauibacter sp.]|uniref:hypothetical protein n=1 Tax=Candidatus Palauibacter sp. TaxID=3101350 RepID=UPI003B020837